MLVKNWKSHFPPEIEALQVHFFKMIAKPKSRILLP